MHCILVVVQLHSVILPEILLSEKLYCYFHIHHQLMFGYISLYSAILVPNNSFIMLVNILLFQDYSCQIYYLLFSIIIMPA